MSAHLGKEVDRLKKNILELCTIVEERFNNAVQAIETCDSELARRVAENDIDIDRKEIEIEEECLKILALYQPVAVDLRYVVACLKLNNDLERIGDLAVHLAQNALTLKRENVTQIPVDFSNIEKATRKMLRMSIDALINSSASSAMNVCIADDDVDDMERDIKKRLKAMIKEDPENLDAYLAMIGFAKNLERIADCCTNIAEDVIYLVNGEIIRHKPEFEDAK